MHYRPRSTERASSAKAKETRVKKKATKARRAKKGPAEEKFTWVGKPIPRKEESRLVQGAGIFTDDYKLAGMLYIRFVRSPYAHARLKHVDVSGAASAPGVVCTLTGAEVAGLVQPFIELGFGPGQMVKDYPLAIAKVVYQGEPVAAVVAETRLAAEDAADLVQAEYEPLPPVLTAEEALKDESILHPGAGTNKLWHGLFEYGNVDKAFHKAAHVVHIGGGFGIKITNYPYMALCALASRKAGGRPVKWAETRTEHMLASAHGNERTFFDTRVALDKNGVIQAIESRHVDDCGAYPRYEPLGCVIWAQVLPGAYRVRNVRFDMSQVCSNKCPVGPNRGYSRMQHLWFLERVMDICAHQLGIPGDEMRLRNYIRTGEMPYTTPNGCVYDSGDYAQMLDIAKRLIGWEEWKQKQQQVRAQGRMMGLGIGTTLDSGTNNFGQARIINPDAPFSGQSKAANAKLDIYGEVVVSMGSVPQGQGHETTAAQVAADVLNIPPDMVKVKPGFDTEQNVYTGHTGTYASQFAVTGLSAIHGAAVKLKKEMSRLAAFALKAKEKALEFGVGQQGPEVRVQGTKKAINYWGLANLVNTNNAGIPEKLWDVTLNCRHVYHAPFQIPDIKRKYGNLTLTYAAQLHIAVIEVDRETFQPKILAYAAVDDCGRTINPLIVEGQVHGATAHGIGAALMENCAYDPDGNMLAATFSDYTPITAVNMPDLLYGHLESPSPFSYNGAKGMGEGGAAPVHTICAALQDAVFPSGIIINGSHNTGDTLFHAFERSKSGENAGVRVESHRAAR